MTQSYAALPHTSITLYVVYQSALFSELGEKPNMPAADAHANHANSINANGGVVALPHKANAPLRAAPVLRRNAVFAMHHEDDAYLICSLTSYCQA